MSILSTNKKLISIGAEYSAGQGINITDHIISVVESAVGANYSAGPNINIYDVEGQPTISSKDWSSEIADASANAYEQAIAQIPAPQDLSYISAKVDTNTSGIDYLSGVVITALPSDMATTGDISDLAQSISETYQVKGDYLVRSDSANFYPNTNPSSFVNENWVTAQGYITGVDLSNYYAKNETSSKQEISAAIAAIPLGDEEVNQVVHTNSSTWNTVSGKLDTTSFSDVSGSFLTAHQSLAGYATTAEVNTLSSMLSGAIDYVSANAGKVYEGVSPIVVNNTEDKISADTWTFSAGSNVSFVDDNVNKITRIDCTVTGYNETVLFSGQATGDLTLSDNPLNYERLLITFNASTGTTDMGAGSEIFEPDKTHLVCLHNYFMYQTTQTAFNNMNEAWAVYSGVDTTTWTRTIGGWRNGATYTSNLTNSNDFLKVSKVIGINRKY